jgi:hypothetical protein
MRGAFSGLEMDRELIGQLEKIKAIADEEKAEKTAQALERLINSRKERIADLEKRLEQMRNRRGRQGAEGQGAVGEGEQRQRRPREGMSEEEIQKLREERRAAREAQREQNREQPRQRRERGAAEGQAEER